MTNNIAFYAAKVHPSGVATVGLNPAKNSEKTSDRSSRRRCKKNIFDLEPTSTTDGLARLVHAGHLSVADGVEALAKIGLSSVLNSRIDHKNPEKPILASASSEGSSSASCLQKPIQPPRLPKGINSFGRRRVADGAAVMQKEYGKAGISFCTLTMPALSPSAADTFCINFPEIVHRTVEEIKRDLKRFGVVQDIVFCIELQEKRFQKYSVVAPHLHLLWPAYCPDVKPRKFAIAADRLREIWKQVIARFIIDEEINVAAACDIQKVKKNAAAYMAKYMSKGGKILKEVQDSGKGHLLPKRWWGMSKSLRVKVKAAIVRPSSKTSANIFYCADKLVQLGIVSRVHYIYKTSNIKKNTTVKYQTDNLTGEIKWSIINADTNADMDVDISSVSERCYGAILYLTPKAMCMIPLVLRIVDICDKLTDADICVIRGLISAINNEDMLNDVTAIINGITHEYNNQNLIEIHAKKTE